MKRAGFAIRDVLVGMAVVAMLCVLAVPTLSQVRMDSARQACIGNFRFIAQASASYTNDFAGQMWALSWKSGMKNPLGSNPNFFTSDSQAQSYQAVVILRRLGNLTAQQAPVPSSWISPLLFSHVALLDYVNLPAPASFLACPEDWERQRILDGDLSNVVASGGSWRTPFTSSYTAGTYMWGPSRQTSVAVFGGTALTPMWYTTSADVSIWAVSGSSTINGVNGPKQSSEVRFPSNKVFMSDDYARHNGKPRYYAYQTAAQDLLFHDGSVRYFRTDSTNPGWDPSTASSRGNMTLRFSHTKYADFWGGLDNGAPQANFQAGWYRWTRGGLYGWDVPRLSSMVGKLPNSSIIENEVNTSAATGAW